jgi:hypothetical protein
LTADAGGAEAVHGAGDDAGDDVVVTKESDDDAEDGDDGVTEAAAGRFESRLHAATGRSTTAAHLNTTHRRKTAIRAVFHRR